VLLFLVFIAYTAAIADWNMRAGMIGTGGHRYLGIGGPVFARIVPLLFHAIQLLLPALCCASITVEKERNTIGTLFLTRLSPWSIIYEKLFSRIIPMFTILLLASPVLTYVYSLGGVDTTMLLATFWLLFCECLLVASIAILCSSYFPTTVSAFVASYFLIAVGAGLSALFRNPSFVPSWIWEAILTDGPGSRYVSGGSWVFTSYQGINPTGTQTTAWQTFSSLMSVVGSTMRPLLVTAICLTFARVFLIRRAFVTSSSVLLRIFKKVDGFFTWLNDATTGGIEIIPDSSPLPEDDPVAWRERNKKSMGKARYLFRVLLCLEGPTLFICTTAATASSRSAFESMYYLQGIVWALAVMITAVKAATLFSSERAKETIEPLLATPMTALDLLKQKVEGMKRLLMVVALPVLTVSFTQLLLRTDPSWSMLATPLVLLQPVVYAVVSLIVVWTLLILTVWLCAGIGLRIHSQTKAVLMAVAVMALWVILPIGLIPLFPEYRDVLIIASPASCVYFTEVFLMQTSWAGSTDPYTAGAFANLPAIVPVILSVPLYGVLMFFIRLFVQTGAPQLLNRRENPRVFVKAVSRRNTPQGTTVPVAEG